MADQENYSVYTLRYPLTFRRALQVFYVGMAQDPYKRFIQHLQMEGSNEQKTAVIREIKEAGVAPIMMVEMNCGGDQRFAEGFESYFTEYYRSAGHPLVNKVLSLTDDATRGRGIYEYEQFLLKNRYLYSKWMLWSIRLYTFFFGFFDREAKTDLRSYERQVRMLRSIRQRSYLHPVLLELGPNRSLICPGCGAAVCWADEQGQVQTFACPCEVEIRSKQH